MKNVLLTVLVLAAVLAPAPATRADEAEDRIRRDAGDALQAMIEADHRRMVELSYPRIVELVGGEERMMELLATTARQIESSGLELTAATIESISDRVRAGDELHAVVHVTFDIDTPDGPLEQATYFIAVTRNDGESWTFVDGSQLTPDLIEVVFPDFNEDLDLPPVPRPDVSPAP